MSDVFSYGIMLLEVFTGKRPTNPLFGGELSLRQWVSEAFPFKLIDVVDPEVLSSGGKSDCHADERTPMQKVVVKLNKIKADYCFQMM